MPAKNKKMPHLKAQSMLKYLHAVSVISMHFGMSCNSASEMFIRRYGVIPDGPLHSQVWVKLYMYQEQCFCAIIRIDSFDTEIKGRGASQG